MKKTALIIMVITIVSKIAGFGREILLSYIYGATSISDAYLISLTIPGVIFSIITAGLSAGYIPLYSRVLQDEGNDSSNKFTSNLINLLLVLSTLMVTIGLLFTEPIVRIFAAGFDKSTLLLAIKLTRISLLTVYFTGIASVLTGFLQVNGNYIIPALVGLPFNMIIILSIFSSQFTNLAVLGIGYVLAIGSQVFFMIPYLKRNKFKYTKRIDFKDKKITNMIRIVIPLIVSVSVNQINILIDRTIASQVVIGGISALNFANKLSGFVLGIFVVSIVTALYPIISKLAAEKNFYILKKSISEGITAINILVLPATVGFVVFAKPIIVMLFGRGAFDDVAVNLTSTALIYYSLGMIGFGLSDMLTRVFYSLQDTKTPMIFSIIGVFLNIVLNLILSRFMGLGGLALATSISAIVVTLFLFISLTIKIGSIGLKQIVISFCKILVSSILMGAISRNCYLYLKIILSESNSLLLSIGIGMISYFIIISLMKIEDVDLFISTLKKNIEKYIR